MRKIMSLHVTESVVAQEVRSNFPVTENWNSCVELSIVCPYLSTFVDPRQMEYMCISVDCFFFPLWNGLDRTSPVLGSTLHQNEALIPGYKPRYRLEVLLFPFQ